jgi:hypothetical protein
LLIAQKLKIQHIAGVFELTPGVINKVGIAAGSHH